MAKEYSAKVFKSGNSVALRLPKALGLTEGMEMTVREERGTFVVEPASRIAPKVDLTDIYGSVPDLRPLGREDRLMEPREVGRIGG